VIGISRDQWRLAAAALALGGNVRAGLEDNFYLPNGDMARSNGDLVAKARQMAEDTGRRPATVAEAREMLGVPRREEVTRREALSHPLEAAEQSPE
jgi:3-keto-5-aminohexanoate cleavage enzyme